MIPSPRGGKPPPTPTGRASAAAAASVRPFSPGYGDPPSTTNARVLDEEALQLTAAWQATMKVRSVADCFPTVCAVCFTSSLACVHALPTSAHRGVGSCTVRAGGRAVSGVGAQPRCAARGAGKARGTVAASAGGRCCHVPSLPMCAGWVLQPDAATPKASGRHAGKGSVSPRTPWSRCPHVCCARRCGAKSNAHGCSQPGKPATRGSCGGARRRGARTCQ